MSARKNELSKKSLYHINKHRFLELKHFCLQYQDWKDRLLEMSDISAYRWDVPGSGRVSNETERIAIERSVLQSKIDLVERVAKMTDPTLWVYILKGVTEDVGYVYLRNMVRIPCGERQYYERYRKFFWIMDREKQNMNAA